MRIRAFFALDLVLFKKKMKPRPPPAGFGFVYSNDNLYYNSVNGIEEYYGY